MLEEGGAAPGEGVRLPSLSLSIYKGKGVEEAPLGSLGEGAHQPTKGLSAPPTHLT